MISNPVLAVVDDGATKMVEWYVGEVRFALYFEGHGQVTWTFISKKRNGPIDGASGSLSKDDIASLTKLFTAALRGRE